MNQPTREEFDELKEEVRQLREQLTEPMKEEPFTPMAEA
jgi:HAMP domain-containing protein